MSNRSLVSNGPHGSDSSSQFETTTGPWGKGITEGANLIDHEVVAVQRRILEQIERERQDRVQPYPSSMPVNRSEDLALHEYDVDITLALTDEDLILHQHRIFEQIQRDNQEKREAHALPSMKTTVSDDVGLHASCANQTALYEGPRLSILGAVTRPLGRDWGKNSGIEAPTSAIGVMATTTDDCVQKVSAVKKLRLKGTRHVYKAIEQGTSALAQCFNCHTILHVPKSCTAVYCSMCHQVTPMELACATTNSCDARSSKIDTTIGDDEIAAILQQQELDVACARDAVHWMNASPPKSM